MGVSAIILAAGSGVRMGADKLALPFGGGTLLAASLLPYLACGVLDEVVVVVRPGFEVPVAGVRAVVNERHAEGMGTSLRVGVTAASPGARAFVLGLGDLPWLRPATVAGAVAAWEQAGGVVIPTSRGRRGHPVVVDAALRGVLATAAGDVGARALLAAHGSAVTLWETDDAGVWRDVDTPGDLPAREPGAASAAGEAR